MDVGSGRGAGLGERESDKEEVKNENYRRVATVEEDREWT